LHLYINLMEYFNYGQALPLEMGQALHNLTIAYCTYGKINDTASNVVWICHALTADADVAKWWPGMVGPGCLFDTNHYFVVCANILGSCYGSSGPLSPGANGEPLYHDFPFVTIRDMVNAHILLREHLGIAQIKLLVGGSMGGYQALEWSLMEPVVIQQLVLMATSAAESAWGIAIHEAQRLAIAADSTWQERHPLAGQKGLIAARATGMLTYRNYTIMVHKQADEDMAKTDGFKAASYIQYQGNKLAKRFNACSYWILTRAMDSHNIARNRYNNLQQALKMVQPATLVIGINSDILCPVEEQQVLADNIPQATLAVIDSEYGHDGFMVEVGKITTLIKDWLKSQQY
jgi:homoserine O-acetyltransferase/O-succinyltransferase